ncbi:hypothetical protein AJ79_07753 [Helicocarpus griseus UAMH5409]|uniref:xylan 1,4-beta-xylosidase n=1 Tax=Helicocarpus griseus UAMH5409 TaxID=1447875 RepID=A0A2B7WZA7_9EURO|nr:hypothetical protein AJ79_07753 [Helicocarpus griseus UAMH5409]
MRPLTSPALLLAAAAALYSSTTLAAFPDCINGPLSENSICDSSLPPAERVAGLLSVLNITEKIANVNNAAPGSERLGLPPYEWWNEALHGVANSPGVHFAEPGEEFDSATSFPQPILIGAAFDDDLVYEIAKTVSTEARAFSNAGRAGLDFWTPDINPFKDPRWGRGQETPGEDPLHLQRYVAKLLAGLEGSHDDDDDAPYKRLVASCKHYTAYDFEALGNTTRHNFDALVPAADMTEYYMPPFKTCARDSAVGSFMCSYNSVNGMPACANSYLLQDILRDHWGWNAADQWITGDCGAVGDIWEHHGYAGDGIEAAALALKAGTDLDCGTTYLQFLPGALEAGLVEESDFDRALARLYTSLIRLGYFDDPAQQPYRQLGWADVNTDAAQELAYEAAAAGIVLIKNDNGILPLNPQTSGHIALIGPYANATTQLQGNYFGAAPYLHSPLHGAERAGFTVTYAPGTEVDTDDTSGFAAALAAAEAADIIVFAGGIDNTIEAEERDRTAIGWPGNQLELIAQLKMTTGKPVVVVVFGGGQVDSSVLLHGQDEGGGGGVDALLWAGYPGQAGGRAVFDIISGARAPAGRLPVTQYPAEYVEAVEMTYMPLAPVTDEGEEGSSKSPGRTYKWYTGEPVVEFGHGLHYTSFELAWAQDEEDEKMPTTFDTAELIAGAPDAAKPDLAPLHTFRVTVRNTGDVTSDYAVLAFVSALDSPLAQNPHKSLVAYARVRGVEGGGGGSAEADLEVNLAGLARAESGSGNLVLYPGKYVLRVDVPVQLEWQFEIVGEAVVLEEWPVAPVEEEGGRLNE